MSLIFLCIAAMLTVGVTLLLIFPLLKTPGRSDQRGNEERDSLYRQHLDELEQERAARAITEEQYRQSREELVRRVVEETPVASLSRPALGWTPSAKASALVLIVAVPAVAFALYWTLGSPSAIVHSATSVGEQSTNPEYDHQSQLGLETLTDRLKRRMADNPKDGSGWALLARSYVELRRHEEAAIAFEKAIKLIPDDAQLLVDYADALAMVQGRTLEGRPEELVKRALQMDARNVKGLMLAGTIAYDHKDLRTALKQWEMAQKELPPETEPELRQELSGSINEVRRLLGLSPAQVSLASAQPAGGSRASAVSAGNSRTITGTVTIASNLKGKASPGDTLFVFARSVGGPPMPVAIQRGTARELPYSFRLDDSMSPMPTTKLSEAGEVIIVARLSRSGEAAPKSGDLQGTSRPIRLGAQNLQISIDSELP